MFKRGVNFVKNHKKGVIAVVIALLAILIGVFLYSSGTLGTNKSSGGIPDDPPAEVGVPDPKFDAMHEFTAGPVQLSGHNALTFSTWMYIPASVTTKTSPSQIFSLVGSNNPSEQVDIKINTQQIIDGTKSPAMVASFGGVTKHSERSGILPIDTWFHYTCTFAPRDGGKTRINHYLNGKYSYGRTKPTNISDMLNQEFVVGIGKGINGEGFEGQLANVGIWKTGLSDSELLKLYNTNEIAAPLAIVVSFGFSASP